MPLLLLTSITTACGPGWATFQEDAVVASCERMEDCGLLTDIGETMETCIEGRMAAVEPGEDACPAYDPQQADACLDALETIDCAALKAGTGLDACSLVCGG